jgi:hypothetical protein
MKTTHTPGPWEVASSDVTVIVSQRPNEPYKVTVAETMGYKIEREANARLIAAAPDLLEALHDLLERVQTAGQYNRMISECNEAEKAIAKAEGHTAPQSCKNCGGTDTLRLEGAKGHRPRWVCIGCNWVLDPQPEGRS